MASLALRTRDQPDIRARISIHDESPNDIKEQLQIADQTQRALRSQQTWHPPDAAGSLHRAPLRKARTLPYPYRPGHFNEIPASDPLPCPLDRSNSLNSLSTIQRESEAASLSLYRGSPISAISPPCIPPIWKPDIEYEPQDPVPPRPPMRVETLSQQRKYQKLLKKSLQKKEKEQMKAQKEDEQLRRAFLAAEVAAARRKEAIARGESLPLRSKSTRSLASQVAKSISLKQPLGKLSRRVKKEKSDPPTLDDFDSKEEVHEYLNPPQPPPSAQIAELPAELPQYTPFQDSTRTQDNEPVALLEDAPSMKGRDLESPSNDKKTEESARPTPRSMRCDSCQSPIRLHQIYYHCSICEDGDRMLCSSCDQAGWSCRHDITEKVRSVSRAGRSQRTDSATMSRERGRSEAQQYAAALWGLSMPDFSAEPSRWAESPLQATMSAASPWAYNDILEWKQSKREAQQKVVHTSHKSDAAKELDFRQRERDMITREKEITLRERETAMREQQASLREQQALLREQAAALNVKQQLFTLQLQSAVAKQVSELSSVGTQFQDLAQNDNIRTHATKRKAGGGQAAISPSNSTGSDHKSSVKRTPSGGRDSNEEDEDATGGTPKKIKQDPDALQTPEKLYACPYCKFDKSRYSEQNVHEKQYRGCSSGYWPDISRLKQHLYRVHWLGIHCSSCYTKFNTKDLLDQHVRGAVPCALGECPNPEKFGDAEYNEIRKKRPASTPEQVWYTIYSILFPGMSQPGSPYADSETIHQAPSPSAPETQDTMDVLGELFESRLDQHTHVPGRDWLRSPEAREFIRRELRASMTDVLQRLKPVNSPSAGNHSVEVSPYSAVAPDSALRSSISLTPASSVPPSPINGSGSGNRSSDSHFLLPGHRQSFSRPLPARIVSRLTVPQTAHKSQAVGDSATGTTFPLPTTVDPENDQYDEECNSWSHGDELGLAISTGFNFGFTATADQLAQMPSTFAPPTAFADAPVKGASVDDQSAQTSAPKPASHLKPKHSTTSSVDSGYGSLGHASSSASASPSTSVSSRPQSHTRPSRQPRDGMKGDKRKREPGQEQAPEQHVQAKFNVNANPTSKAKDRESSSPVPESAINFEALDVSFQEFLDGGLSLDLDMPMDMGLPMDVFGDMDVNVGAATLTAYLDGRYPAPGG